MTEDQREIRRKKSVIEYAERIGHVGTTESPGQRSIFGGIATGNQAMMD